MLRKQKIRHLIQICLMLCMIVSIGMIGKASETEHLVVEVGSQPYFWAGYNPFPYRGDTYYSSLNNDVVTISMQVPDSHRYIAIYSMTALKKGQATIVATTSNTDGTYIRKMYVIDVVDPGTSPCSIRGHKWERSTDGLNPADASDLAASCLKDGLLMDYCTSCGERKYTRTPALGHDWEKGKVLKEPTCTEEGSIRYSCTRCSETKTEVLPKAAHPWRTNYTQDREPTCTKEGQKSIYCKVCDARKPGSTTAIPMLAHRSVTDPAVPATSTETGLTEGSHCSVCGTVLKKQEVIPSLGDASYRPRLNVSSITLKYGQSTTAVKVIGLSLGDSVIWGSGNPAIVSVDQHGRITAKKKAGTAVVIATTASGRSLTVKVKVQKGSVKTTKISGLSKSIRLESGKTIQLSPTVTPVTTTDKLTFTSSNKKIAAVNSKGVITAKASGTAKITVKSGSRKFVVTITVPKKAPSAVTNVPETKTLKLKKSFTIKPGLAPAGSSAAIKYSSSDKKVASVTSGGKVTAKKKGTAVITVTAGKVKTQCVVTVK